MRVAMMVAGAVAAAIVSVPAVAQTVANVNLDGFRQITEGYSDFCSNKYDQTTCVRTAVTSISGLPQPNFLITVIDGVYPFSGLFGTSINSGVYNYSGSVTFSGGSLISDIYNFSYNLSQVGDVTYKSVFVRGYISNSTVTIFRLGGQPVTLTPIPEPAPWAMMLAGFGAIGYAMRRRRRHTMARLSEILP